MFLCLSSVMASPGLPLLLLVLSSFLICSLSVPQTSNLQENRALQKRGKKLEEAKTAGKYLLKIATALKPFIGLIPEAGTYLNHLIDVANVVAGTNPEQQILDFLKLKFDDLNAKIDENQKKTEWNIWTSSEYGKLEKKITVAWNKLVELLKDCAEPCIDSLKKDGKDKIIEEYFKKAEKMVDDLHHHIAASGAYNVEYEKLLKDHVRCHEHRIKIYSAINAWLVYKAIVMTHFYNRFNNIKTNEDSLANKAREISAAMFQIQKNCISDPDNFVELDIKDRIDPSVKRKDLAREIRNYLDKTYNRYDWMVVVFITDHSKYESIFTKWKNRHILTGFTVVDHKTISVAVAKQAKGTHKKTHQVIEEIKKCYDKTVACTEVKAKLEECSKLKDTYTAIHAFIHKKHDSVHALEAEEAPTEEQLDPEEEEQKIPYIYKGKCSILLGVNGHFRVLVKSDEEWMKEDPCKNVKCGDPKQGKCVVVKSARIGLCECEKGYYGESCEESMEEYKKSISSETIPKALTV